MPEPGRRRRATLLRAIAAAGLLVWLVLDVYPRSVVRPLEPDRHKSDFTVYLVAAEALYHGGDPYSAPNPRGWTYTYAPLVAVLAWPFTSLRPEHGAAIWYLLQCLMMFGLVGEIGRLRARATDAADAPWWIGCGALLAFALLIIEAPQRGNIQVAVVWLLVVGYRLATGDSRREAFLGGLVLAVPLCTKLVPGLPAVGAVALACRRRSGRPAAAGLALGLLVCLLLLPAAVVGWGRNLDLLREWHARVIVSHEFGANPTLNITSFRNQSLPHAAQMAGSWWRGGGLDDGGWTRGPLVLGLELVVTVLLLAAVVRVPAADHVASAAVFGLWAAAMAVYSPVTWVHHYAAAVTAFYFLPLAAWRRGARRTAYALATVPWVLAFAHHVLQGWAGLLGLAMAAWLLWSLIWLIRDARVPPP